MDELAKLLPEFHFSDRHERLVAAPPALVYDVAREIRVEQVPSLRMLFTMRWIPGIVTGSRRRLSPAAKALDEVLDLGFTLAWEEPPRGYAFVGVGRYWQLDSGIRPLSSVDEFRSFSEPGFAKVAIGMVVVPEDAACARIITETRVLGTDVAARRRFGAYWTIIKPGSTAIRLSLLRAIGVEAEALARQQPPVSRPVSS